MSTSDFLSNDLNKLLILVEPTEQDLIAYPFLRGWGGVLRRYRHPILIKMCDTYNVYKLAELKINNNMEFAKKLKNEIEDFYDLSGTSFANEKKMKFSNEKLKELENECLELTKLKEKCFLRLNEFLNGEFEFRLQDLLPGGIYFENYY